MATTPVTQALDQLGIPYRFFSHPGPVHSVEQAARERGMQIDQVVRSIVFRLGEGEFVMVLAPGEHQINWPALRKYLQRSRLTLASEEEVLQVTGYKLGAVSPFGLPHPMRILVDCSIFNQSEISLGSGLRGSTVILSMDDFRKALSQAEVVDLIRA
jgi:Cys-tRNA(Pro) deacylase